MELADFCVSTIIDRRRLEEFALKGQGKVTERRAWITAKRLFDELNDGVRMPVIFSDAAFNAENLLLWALLKEIRIEGNQTSFSFNGAKRIPGNHHRTDLKLRSTGKPIAENFIRPYSICETPPFLK
jgi:hypothetical protein